MGKGALTILSVLAVLSCLLLAGAGGAIAPTGGDVYVEETVLAGDPAAAQGLYVSAEYQCEDQMHWRTRIPVGCGAEQETAFTYTTGPVREVWFPSYPRMSIDFFDGTTYLRMDEAGEPEQGWVSDTTRKLPMMQRILQVAKEARLQEESGGLAAHEGAFYQEDLLLEKEYQYLPLRFTPWGIPFMMDEYDAILDEYFRIPTPPGLTLHVEVGHDGYTYWVSAGFPEGKLDLTCDTVFLDEENREDLLFTVSLEGCTIPLDGSLIPGGWGIYRLTCVKDENQVLQPPRLTTVYSVPEGERVFRFWADKTGLFLLTCGEDGMLRLTVLDRASFAPRYTLDLFPFPQGQAVLFPDCDGNYTDPKGIVLRQVYQGEDFLVIHTGYEDIREPAQYTILPDGSAVSISGSAQAPEPEEDPPPEPEELYASLTLIVREDSGWRVRFTASLDRMELENLGIGDREVTHMAFDGTRLAVAGTSGNTRYGTPYAAVWSGPELAFLATYQHSLERGHWRGSDLYCGPVQDGPAWTVSWQR